MNTYFMEKQIMKINYGYNFKTSKIMTKPTMAKLIMLNQLSWLNLIRLNQLLLN